MKINPKTRLFLKSILVLFVILFCTEGFSFHGHGYGYGGYTAGYGVGRGSGEHVNGAWAYRRQKAKQLPSAAYYADIEGGYPYNQGSPAQDMTYYDDPAVVIPNTGPTPWHYRVWNDRIGVGTSAYPQGYGFDGQGSFAGHAGYIYDDPNVANAQGAVIRDMKGHNSYFNIPQSVYREQRQLSRGMNGGIVGGIGAAGMGGGLLHHGAPGAVYSNNVNGSAISTESPAAGTNGSNCPNGS
ncbi:MAG: hypothetical protein Q4G69_00975, partial [Planctomycetia bacterium]|nr:hypothetical protein [Planctomycetia bacterium]